VVQDSERLRAALSRTRWLQADWVAEVGSTNAELVVAARAGALDGTVLISDYQHQGRGRFDRSWVAPPGTAVAVSALSRPQVPLARWTWLPLLAGLAVAEGVQDATGLKAELKWPNDVLIDAKKVCGILVETVAGVQEAVDAPAPGHPMKAASIEAAVIGTTGTAAVIGMGINTAMTADQLPVPTATSLSLSGSTAEPMAVVVAVLRSLDRWLGRWADGEDLRADYLRRCATIGRRVRVLLPESESRTGVACGVSPSGELLVREGAEIHAFAAGDVLHLR
jgi:BirA family biotin operon repressor/biotin-[acetyl-CoA-carboxylase] ligase